ncbi:MAG: hypothetical protein KatS3mg109_1042 [Pirellulaceae bacterium]|nr:MAG: hypothetical protein KatS3mg109_1042 [Pirellulaceae bacterium]
MTVQLRTLVWAGWIIGWLLLSSYLVSAQQPSIYGDASAIPESPDLPSVLKRSSPLPGADAGESAPNTSRRTLPDTAADAPDLLPANENGTAPYTSPRATTASRTIGVVPDSQRVALAQSAAVPLRVELIGPPSLSVGKSARLQLVVSNPSPSAAREVVFSISVPGSLEIINSGSEIGEVKRSAERRIDWQMTELAAGARAVLEIEVTARHEAPVELLVDWTQRSLATASIRVVKPLLQVTIHGPDEILYGTRQIYTISVANPGTGPAENVTLDVVSGGAGQGKRLGTIAPGGEQQIRMELVARDAGWLEIRATASADGLRQEATRRVLVRRAELAVSAYGPELAFAGTPGVYQIEVANVGNATAQEAEISVRLPAGVTYVKGVDGAAASAGRVTWKIRGLAAGERQKYALEVHFDKPGELVAQVQAALPGEVASTASLTTRVDAVADLKLEVHDPQGPQPVGQDAVYEVRITNRGSKAASDVKVLGQYSRGIEPVRAEGAQAQIVPGQVIFAPLPRIEPGQTVTLRIVARAEAAGNHRFRATIQATDPGIELIAEETTPFYDRTAGR